MNKKRFRNVVLGITGAVLAMFLILSLSLSDSNINGLRGTLGIVRLVFSDSSGVKLTDNPRQYLVQRNLRDSNINVFARFLDEHTDYFSLDPDYTGEATINGTRYRFGYRSFTNMYWIITFTEIEEYGILFDYIN